MLPGQTICITVVQLILRGRQICIYTFSNTVGAEYNHRSFYPVQIFFTNSPPLMFKKDSYFQCWKSKTYTVRKVLSDFAVQYLTDDAIAKLSQN